MSGCEGGCGCRLSVDGRETADGVTTVYWHTVDRCRLIRTLREAGQAAVGAEGTSVVRTHLSPEAFVVDVQHPHHTVAVEASVSWFGVQCLVPAETAWRMHSPDHLGELGAWVEETISHALAEPHKVGSGPPVSGPTLARDPYQRGSS